MGNPKQITKEHAAEVRESIMIREMEKRVGVTIHKNSPYAKNAYRVFIHPCMAGTKLYNYGVTGRHRDFKSFRKMMEGVAKIMEGRDGK